MPKKRVTDRGDVSFRGDRNFSASIEDILRGEIKKPYQPEGTGGQKTDGAQPDPEVFLKSVVQTTLHRQTSGHGGKVVTLLSFRPAPDDETAGALAKTMRKALGCGSRAEGGMIIIQGDIRGRISEWLGERGGGKIVRGN